MVYLTDTPLSRASRVVAPPLPHLVLCNVSQLVIRSALAAAVMITKGSEVPSDNNPVTQLLTAVRIIWIKKNNPDAVPAIAP